MATCKACKKIFVIRVQHSLLHTSTGVLGIYPLRICGPYCAFRQDVLKQAFHQRAYDAECLCFTHNVQAINSVSSLHSLFFLIVWVLRQGLAIHLRFPFYSLSAMSLNLMVILSSCPGYCDWRHMPPYPVLQSPFVMISILWWWVHF